MKNWKNIILLPGLAVLLMTINSCNNGENKHQETTTSVAQKMKSIQSSAEDTPTKTTPEKTGPDTIKIYRMAFHPQHLTVKKGDTVVWLNNGIVAHDVTVDSLGHWTSDSIHKKHTWKKVIDKSFNYFCSIHPTMTGSIEVDE